MDPDVKPTYNLTIVKKFRVHVPFVEHDHEHPEGRTFSMDYEVDAADWLGAMDNAVKRFEDANRGDYHSWVCEVSRERVVVTELESGQKFCVDDTGEIRAAKSNGNPDPPELLIADEPALPMPFEEISRVLALQEAPRVLLGPLVELAMRATRAEAASLLQFDPDRGDLFFLETRGQKAEEVKRYRLELGQGIAGWCAVHAEPIAVYDAPGHPQFYARIGREIGFETRSICCAPTTVGGRMLGVLELLNRRGNPRFSPGEIAFAGAVGRVAGLLMHAAATTTGR